MKKPPFPWLALGIGLVLALVLLRGGAAGPADQYSLPLLTMLVLNEFGFFLCAAGAYMAARRLSQQGFRVGMGGLLLGCVLLCAGFAWLGLALWPETGLTLNNPA